MKGWLGQQYRDIKGHLKFEMLRQLVAILSGATVVGLLYAFWQRLRQVPIDLYLFGGLFILSAVIFLYFARGVQTVRSAEQSKEEPSEPVPAPALIPTPTPVDPRKPDLKCEIQEILFYVEKLGILSNIYVLAQVRVVNYGEQEVGVTAWKLTVEAGKNVSRAKEEPIPRDWKIRRWMPGKSDVVKKIDKKFTESEPFKKGIPQLGWILFKLATMPPQHPPYAAKFTLEAKDALGDKHVTIRDPSFMEESGEIFVAPD
jgi:hypothetical protein